jgi:FKBP-type peptidyl-prolyl cis-trans isomerase 2
MQTKQKDFVEIEFTGYHNGVVFDSNISEDLKKLSSEAKPEKSIVIIGQGMVVKGLDKALEEKKIGKEYNIHLQYKDAFGERKRELVKTIPLNVFTKQKINPRPGLSLFLDNMVARVITVSGARVITDFNNPLAGKEIDYKFTIKRIVDDEKEKTETFFKLFFRHIPELEIKDKIIVKGTKEAEPLIEMFNDKAKEFLGKELEFKLEEKLEKSEEKLKGQLEVSQQKS